MQATSLGDGGGDEEVETGAEAKLRHSEELGPARPSFDGRRAEEDSQRLRRTVYIEVNVLEGGRDGPPTVESNGRRFHGETSGLRCACLRARH